MIRRRGDVETPRLLRVGHDVRKETVANTIVPTGELGEKTRIPLDHEEKNEIFALGKCSDTATVSLLFPFLSADEKMFFVLSFSSQHCMFQ